MAALVEEEMARQFIGKQASNWANIAVFEKYRGGQQRWNKREKAWMAEDGWPKKGKPAD